VSKRVSKRERKRKKKRKQARKGAMTSRRGKRKILKFYHGTLTYGKDSVRFTSFTNLFGSAPFCIGNIIYLFYKTSYLNKEFNCTDPSPSERLPGRTNRMASCFQSFKTFFSLVYVFPEQVNSP
jgi:hypothetical protein